MTFRFNATPSTISATLCLLLTLDHAQASDTTTSTTSANEVEETIVLGFRKASFTEITENAEKLVNIPGTTGDPLGAITSLPGIITPRSGGSPAVRGSSPEDNRYYIDGMPAGYIFHQFNTSIIDENIIQDFQLFTAGFGAQYSQATGAIFDIRLRDPANIDTSTTLTASMLRAGIFVESGITDNSAFYISGRKGMLPFFLSEEDEASDEGFRIISAPDDSDYQFKYQWKINPQHTLTVSAAGATDFAEAEITDLADLVQKNPDFAGDARIDKQFDSMVVNYEYLSDNDNKLQLTLADYTDEQLTAWGEDYSLVLKLDNQILRSNYSIPVSDHVTVNFGGEHNQKRYHYDARLIEFTCTDLDVDCQDNRGDLIEVTEILDINESNLYNSTQWQATEEMTIEAGLQYTGNDYTDEYQFNPKAALTWVINDKVSLISSAGRYQRTPNIETILESIGNPDLRSPQAQHYTLGFKGDVNDEWDWLIEFYHKRLSRLALSLDDSQPDAENRYSNDAEGTANGLDIMLNKKFTDRWFGWASLSVSDSNRKNLRTGLETDYTLDTPVVFNLVGNYQISENWTGGLRYSYKTGEANTKIIGIKPNPYFPDRYLPVYGEPFADHLPAYHRIDLRFERQFIAFNNDASFFIDIINLLNRENVSEQELDYEKVNETGQLHVTNSTDMGLFGSLGASIRF